MQAIGGVHENKIDLQVWMVSEKKLLKLNLISFEYEQYESKEDVSSLVSMNGGKFCVYGDQNRFFYDGKKFLRKERHDRISNLCNQKMVVNGNFLIRHSNHITKSFLWMYACETEKLMDVYEFNEKKILNYEVFENKIFIHTVDDSSWNTHRIFCLEEMTKK